MKPISLGIMFLSTSRDPIVFMRYFWHVSFPDSSWNQIGWAESFDDAVGFIQHAIEDAHGEDFDPVATASLK